MKRILSVILVIVSINLNSQTIISDSNFGTNGFAVLNGDTTGGPIRTLIQPDGKILVTNTRVVTGNNWENFICRYNSNGQIDTSFGTNGFFILSYLTGIDDNGAELKLLANGKILLISNVSGTKVAKLNINGTLDTTFGVNGVVSFNPFQLNDFEQSNVILDSNEDLILFGDINSISTLIKLKSNDGARDTTFGSNGEVTLNIGNIRELVDIKNGKYYFRTFDDVVKTSNLIRLTSTFNLDGTFNTFGAVTIYTALTTQDDNSNIVIDNSENIYVLAQQRNTNIISFKKYNSSGIVINSFFTNVGSSIGTSDVVRAMIIKNNKLILTGAKVQTTINSFIARFNNDGTIDNTFNSNGFYIESGNTWQEFNQSIAINLDNSIVIAGQYSNGTYNKMFLGKYITNNLSVNNFERIKLNFVNPIQNELEINSIEKISLIELYNIEGKLISKTFTNRLVTTEFKKGLYLAKVTFENGKSQTEKILKD
jgi:uncharacterized delta-60 repeat protein